MLALLDLQPENFEAEDPEGGRTTTAVLFPENAELCSIANVPAGVLEPEHRKVIMDRVPDKDTATEKRTDLLACAVKGDRGSHVTWADTRDGCAPICDGLRWADKRVEDDMTVKIDDGDTSKLGAFVGRRLTTADHLTVKRKVPTYL